MPSGERSQEEAKTCKGDSMMGMAKVLRRLWKDESGISSVEYALLLAMIAAGIAVAAAALGDAVFNEINDAAACVGSDTPETEEACGNADGGGGGGDGG